MESPTTVDYEEGEYNPEDDEDILPEEEDTNLKQMRTYIESLRINHIIFDDHLCLSELDGESLLYYLFALAYISYRTKRGNGVNSARPRVDYSDILAEKLQISERLKRMEAWNTPLRDWTPDNWEQNSNETRLIIKAERDKMKKERDFAYR